MSSSPRLSGICLPFGHCPALPGSGSLSTPEDRDGSGGQQSTHFSSVAQHKFSLSLGPSVLRRLKAKLCWLAQHPLHTETAARHIVLHSTLLAPPSFPHRPSGGAGGRTNLTEIRNGVHERDGSCGDVIIVDAPNAGCIPKMDFNILHVWKGRCPLPGTRTFPLACVILSGTSTPPLLVFCFTFFFFFCFHHDHVTLILSGNDHEYIDMPAIEPEPEPRPCLAHFALA